MEITENVKIIKKHLKLISLLEKEFEMKPNYDSNDPLLYCGIVKSDLISKLESHVEEYFGKPYKPAGQSAFFKSMFDPFVKDIGGIRFEQTLYKKDITPGVVLYCAFWPWATDPQKTSIRIGLLCLFKDMEEEYTKHLKGYF